VSSHSKYTTTQDLIERKSLYMWQFAIGYKVSHETKIEGEMGDDQLK